jgi:hypothetical protein
MIIESIKEGFNLTHRNWQVVLLKVAAGIINLIGFFIVVGIPVAIGIFSLGIDIFQARDLLPEIVNNPLEFFSKYLGLVILIFSSIIFYASIASVLILYVFSGTLGVLRNTALNGNYAFRFSSFFTEARNAFFPLLWLFSIAFLVVSSLLIGFAVMAIVIISLTGISGDPKTTLSLFMTYFFGLLGLVIILLGIIFTAYSAVALMVEKGRVLNSFSCTWNFIKNKPMSFVFYIILVIGIIASNFILLALGASLSAAPMIGYIFIIPHRLISSLVQSYLGMVMWGALISYYMKAVKGPSREASNPEYDI